MEITSAAQELQRQQDLVKKLDEEGWHIVVGAAFVRGMRDIGYKSASYAVAEIVDNAIQASANHVDVVFGFDSGLKPTKVAIVDDGHGMGDGMVRASLIWGAGTRSDNRTCFGKYGYGLPSASVSQCERVSVYSKVSGGAWHKCYLDVHEIQSGTWGSSGNVLQMPPETMDAPPAFVIDSLKKVKRWDGFEHGTVVVWERLDRMEPKQREKLRSQLLTDLGVVYRNYLVNTPLTVDEVNVDPCDPLFITEGSRYFALDEDRAEALPEAVLDITDGKGGQSVGKMRVRFARMPATFYRKPEYKRSYKPSTRVAMNERWQIAIANDGILFCRNGRQIDHIRPPRDLAQINVSTDNYWKIEVDFDASLDHLFSITTSKQQVVPNRSVWDMLDQRAKLWGNVSAMRTKYGKEAKVVQDEAEANRNEKRPSVVSIEGAKRYRTTKPPKDSPERTKEAATNLRQEAQRRAQKAGVSEQMVEQELVAQQEGNPLVVEREDLPEAPFFRCIQRGGQRVLYLNVAHPFFTDLYQGPGATPLLRAGLEILLWALGEAEVDADPDSERRNFYTRERASVWSPYIADALKVLKTMPLMEVDDEPADAVGQQPPAA